MEIEQTLAFGGQQVRHVPVLRLRVGDRVRLLVGQSGSYTDAASEAGDGSIRTDYRVPRGSVGKVVKVQPDVTAFPYVVLFEHKDTELGMAERELERF